MQFAAPNGVVDLKTGGNVYESNAFPISGNVRSLVSESYQKHTF